MRGVVVGCSMIPKAGSCDLGLGVNVGIILEVLLDK